MALKNTFADIAEVHVEKSSYNRNTDTYSMYVKMVNIYGKSASFYYGFTKGDKSIDGYLYVNDLVQKKGTTQSNIKVIYSDGEEGSL